MKTQLLMAMIWLSACAVSAQSINLSWVKQYGGPSYISPRATAVDPSGAVITCGALEGLSDFDPGTGSSPSSSNGMKDAYIAKINANGDFAWAVSFGASNDDIAYDVDVDAAGNVYCTGEFRGTVNFNPLGTTTNLTAFSGYNAFIVKYSPDGVFQWVKKFGGTSQGYESGRTLDVDPFGNILSSGVFYGAVDFDPGVGISELNFGGSYGCYVSKLNSNGEFVWAKGFSGYYTTPTELKADDLGNVFCVGYFYDNVDFNPGSGSYILDGQYYDTYITKLNAQGEFIWAKHFTSANYCLTNEIQIADDGSVYAVGGFNGTTDFDPDLVNTQTITNTTSTYRPFLVKLSSDGLFQYIKQLAPNSTGQAIGLGIDAQDNLYIAGNFRGTSDFDPDPLNEFPLSSVNSNYDDIFITKLNSNAEFITCKTIGGYYNETMSALKVNAATGLIILTGSFTDACDFDPSEGQTSLTSAGNTDAFIARYVQCDAINSSVSAEACGFYNFNGNTYTQTGSYEHVLMSTQGCDSIVTLNLVIHSSNFSNVTLYAIDPIEYNGILYSSEGSYTQTLQNQFGCDSTVYIQVDFMEVNFVVQNNGGVLGGNQQGVAYQWVDCNNNNNPIAGATSANFTPTQSGSYALIVYGNDGSVISECIEVTIIGVEEQNSQEVHVYPNPSSGQVYMEAGEVIEYVEVWDIRGALMQVERIHAGRHLLSIDALPNGIYTLRFVGETTHSVRVLKVD